MHKIYNKRKWRLQFTCDAVIHVTSRVDPPTSISPVILVCLPLQLATVRIASLFYRQTCPGIVSNFTKIFPIHQHDFSYICTSAHPFWMSSSLVKDLLIHAHNILQFMTSNHKIYHSQTLYLNKFL